MHGSGSTIVEALNPAELPENILTNLRPGNLEYLQRRYDRQ
jgi:hypothetical protein